MKAPRRKNRITKKNYPFGPIIAQQEFIVLVPGTKLHDLYKKKKNEMQSPK